MRLNQNDLYILKVVDERDRGILREELLNEVRDVLYPDITMGRVVARLKKSVTKLLASGCVQSYPDVFGLEARRKIYVVTPLGEHVVRKTAENDLEVYHIEGETH